MDINLILPFLSSLVMLVFTLSVFQRWLARRKPHFLFWAIGLGMFGAGSFAEAYFHGIGWSASIFFVWYFFGAVLNAAWIGHGTLLLLFRRGWTKAITGLLIAGSLAALALMLRVMPELSPEVFDQARPISEQYGSKVLEPGQEIPANAFVSQATYRGEEVQVIQGILPLGASVRLTTPFFNIYGLFTLVGGALWSAWLFLRKLVLPNRVIGNVLIAAGALSIGLASTLTRLGYGGYLYLGELVAAVLMFAGFRVAAAPSTEAETAEMGAPRASATI